jgi:hypothetical protein
MPPTRFVIRHWTTRAEATVPPRTDHIAIPATMRVEVGSPPWPDHSGRPTAANAQKRKRTVPAIASIQLIRGRTSCHRAASSASIPRPALHQNRIPISGKAMAHHVQRSMPFGTQSFLPRLKMSYGNWTSSGGTFSIVGTILRLSKTSSSCCCCGSRGLI